MSQDFTLLCNKTAIQLNVDPKRLQDFIQTIKPQIARDNVKALMFQNKFYRQIKNGKLRKSKRESLFDSIIKKLQDPNIEVIEIIKKLPPWIKVPFGHDHISRIYAYNLRRGNYQFIHISLEEKLRGK